MFRWAHFLSLASRLAQAQPKRESEARTAIGRAYYAAYGETREHAVRCGLSFSKAKPSHEQVWQFMRSGGGQKTIYRAASSKHIGDQGIALRALRVQADYYPQSAPSEDEVRRAIGLSKEIIDRLKRL